MDFPTDFGPCGSKTASSRSGSSAMNASRRVTMPVSCASTAANPNRTCGNGGPYRAVLEAAEVWNWSPDAALDQVQVPRWTVGAL